MSEPIDYAALETTLAGWGDDDEPRGIYASDVRVLIAKAKEADELQERVEALEEPYTDAGEAVWLAPTAQTYAELWKRSHALASKLTAAHSLLAKAGEALEPFGEVADTYSRGEHVPAWAPSLASFRAARAVLAEIKEALG